MRRIPIIVALALAMPALSALAQGEGGPRPPRRPPGAEGGPKDEMRRAPPLLATLDANKDGAIDEQELAGAAEALKTLDKNGDGKLTVEEFRPPPPGGAEGRGKKHEGAAPGAEGTQAGPKGEGRRPPPPPLIAVLDANRDGVIDAEEIAAAAEALKKLDGDGDGKLSPQELHPPHPGGHGGPEGGQQGGQ